MLLCSRDHQVHILTPLSYFCGCHYAGILRNESKGYNGYLDWRTSIRDFFLRTTDIQEIKQLKLEVQLVNGVSLGIGTFLVSCMDALPLPPPHGSLYSSRNFQSAGMLF